MGDHKGKPVKFKFMTSARGKVRGRVLLNVWERRGPPMLVLPTTMLLLVFLPTTGVRTKVIWGNKKGKPHQVQVGDKRPTKKQNKSSVANASKHRVRER